MQAEEAYTILNLEGKVTLKEIKNAYRALAKKYHPDVCGNDDTHFLQVSKAYEVLTGEVKEKGYFEPLISAYQSNGVASRIISPFETTEDIKTF